MHHIEGALSGLINIQKSGALKDIVMDMVSGIQNDDFLRKPI